MDHVSIQGKIREFEARIRRWRQLKFGFGETTHRRSTSQEPTKACDRDAPNREHLQRKPLPICSTSPLPRKQMNHNGISPLNFGAGRVNTENDEVNRRFEAVRAQSGLLRLGGKIEKCSYGDLQFMEDIGHGSCGHVQKMQYKGHVMAVKQMARTGNADVSRRILMDLDVVLRCQSRHIVICYGFFITDSTVYVCMELMATCLDRFLARINPKRVPEPYIGQMTVSIISALNYLKEGMSIIHRDVKPSNILLDWDGNVKLCDFGIAGQLIESKVFTRNAGCPPYMAPERFQPDVNGMAPYDVRSDVWSVGITLVELARGTYPYPGGSEFEILTALLQMPAPSLSVEEGFTPEFCNFVELCLNKDVEKRPKYDVLMQHPFYLRSLHDSVNLGDWFQDHMSQEE
ncbi:unnamed protein product, partial [Mesorhabditis belari]|uniref:mitogen-activated protein kinase kinase n=1 Tax=Mesorhabditis belari TaxID=2138241 RepID=A0AAF3EH40_9BILA